MSVNELKMAIQHLKHDDYIELVNWLIEYENKVWDQQIENDYASGKLNTLIQSARQDIKNGINSFRVGSPVVVTTSEPTRCHSRESGNPR